MNNLHACNLNSKANNNKINTHLFYSQKITPNDDNHKIVAFTLAEVLITLGIIGVIAAITLPTLIENHQNVELQSRLKKSISTISQAVQRTLIEDYGGTIPTPTSDNTGIVELSENLEKYLIKSSICHLGMRCDKSVFPTDRMSYWVSLRDTEIYKNIVSYALIDDGAIALNDGSIIYLDWGNGGYGYYIFTIDTNGWRKKPNIGGLDVFTFQLLPNGNLIPVGSPESVVTKTDCLTAPNNYCAMPALSEKDYFKKVSRK